MKIEFGMFRPYRAIYHEGLRRKNYESCKAYTDVGLKSDCSHSFLQLVWH